MSQGERNDLQAGDETFEAYRPLLFSIAYRMLGSAMEAEDIVQETYLRYQAAPSGHIRSLKTYLCAIVNNLCLDQLKSARSRREHYVGPWLPEPVLTGDGASLLSPSQIVSDRDSISLAFLVLLESLSPLERAVFLLREVFDYEYAEIAEIVGREEAACRQLFSRAKKHIHEHRPRFHSSPETHARVLASFMTACAVGDLDGLMALLAEDVTVWSDGGGKVTAARRPIHGREHVARLFLGLVRQAPEGAEVEVVEINGKSGVLIRVSGHIDSLYAPEIDDGRVREIRIIRNPDKLAHLNR